MTDDYLNSDELVCECHRTHMENPEPIQDFCTVCGGRIADGQPASGTAISNSPAADQQPPSG